MVDCKLDMDYDPEDDVNSGDDEDGKPSATQTNSDPKTGGQEEPSQEESAASAVNDVLSSSDKLGEEST